VDVNKASKANYSSIYLYLGKTDEISNTHTKKRNRIPNPLLHLFRILLFIEDLKILLMQSIIKHI
jgi:hypothetical protein